MRRVSTKDKLQLDSSFRSCRDVVLETFCEAILKPQDLANYDEELCKKIVLFFVEHYDSIWTPPISLRREVEERVSVPLVDIYIICLCLRLFLNQVVIEDISTMITNLEDCTHNNLGKLTLWVS